MAQGTHFDFLHFNQDDPITLQGGAEIANGVLALNGNGTPGRGVYTPPVPIQDHDGNVASFVTSFSFKIKDTKGAGPGQGIVFFLVPHNWPIPNNSHGGCLGIVDGGNAFNQFVGVEFDTFVNDWDPHYTHIGIDVNSLISLKTVKWNRESDSTVNVNITYDSLSKTLSVAETHAEGQITTVAQVVDLKAVLPKDVWIGFSATIGDGGQETHDILSWSFTSTFETA